jgi:hypothetical protein
VFFKSCFDVGSVAEPHHFDVAPRRKNYSATSPTYSKIEKLIHFDAVTALRVPAPTLQA